MDNTINDVHSVLLEMLQWFHHQCEKNGLRYYIVGGTMLGAVGMTILMSQCHEKII